MIGRFLLVLLSVAALVGIFAQPGSARVSTTVPVCAPQHLQVAKRGLTSARVQKFQKLCGQVHKPASKLKFWNSDEHRWTLYPKYQSLGCGQLRRRSLLMGPEKLCIRARTQVRYSSERLAELASKIKQLLPAPVTENIDLPYRHFTSCLDAVNYLFQGRPDLVRARMVVKRESKYEPKADNGTHFGCAQESSRMMSAHLRGSWNDAYYNVWVLLWEAEHNGWCNWDIVNYCAPGGEF